MAVQHLIAQGHERIVHFAGPPYSMHSGQRVEGVRRAFSETHLAFSDAFVVETGAHLEDGYEAGRAYFKEVALEERPTAVTCYNDLVAIGLLRALNELGLRVPEDISLIGHDDLDILEYLPQPLSSVRMPKFEMGRRAAEMLVRQTEVNRALAPEKLYLDAELILRASVVALNKESIKFRGGR